MIVDFQNSFISWKTHNGSYGRFNAEAWLEFKNIEWLSGSEVMACQVYSGSNLFKVPAYSFQPVFSKDGCKIFRTYTDNLKTGDTSFPPSEQFSEHKVQIAKVNNFKEIVLTKGSDQGKHYQCLITSEKYRLQFPVKHYNTQNSGEYQVETGPVIFPCNNVLSPAFIAFNRNDQFEVLLFETVNEKRNFKVIRETNCEIKLITL